MKFDISVNAALAAARRLAPLALASALALSACVPIPYSSGTRFVANGSDVTVPLMDDGGCGFGPDFRAESYRDFGPVRVSTTLQASNEPNPDLAAGLLISFEERARTTDFQTVSVNPALIRLEEAGRSYSAVDSRFSSQLRNGLANTSAYFVHFPVGTGFDDNIRFVFAPGAITINGSAVDFDPIRFTRRPTTSVYMFPCIPS